MKKIIILGAGFGGLTAAHEFLKYKVDARITVIEQKQEFYMGLTKLWVMVGRDKPESYKHRLEELSKKGINYVNDEVTAINLKDKRIITRNDQFTYDYLIVALGAALAPEKIPGFNQHAFNLYEMEGAAKIYEKIKDFNGKISLLICGQPYKCPSAPYETLFLLHDYFKGKVKLSIYTPEPQPLLTAGLKVGEEVIRMLDEKDIRHHFNHKIMKIEGNIMFFENGNTASADLIIGIPPHVAPSVLKGLVDETGWIPVDPKTLATKFDKVYAVGDNAIVKLPNGKMLPKAGVFAEEQAKIVSHNIANEMRNNKERVSYNGKGYCFMEMGNGMAGSLEGDFFAEHGPVVELKGKSAEYFRKKEEFEKERVKEWLN